MRKINLSLSTAGLKRTKIRAESIWENGEGSSFPKKRHSGISAENYVEICEDAKEILQSSCRVSHTPTGRREIRKSWVHQRIKELIAWLNQTMTFQSNSQPSTHQVDVLLPLSILLSSAFAFSRPGLLPPPRQWWISHDARNRDGGKGLGAYIKHPWRHRGTCLLAPPSHICIPCCTFHLKQQAPFCEHTWTPYPYQGNIGTHRCQDTMLFT